MYSEKDWNNQQINRTPKAEQANEQKLPPIPPAFPRKTTTEFAVHFFLYCGMGEKLTEKKRESLLHRDRLFDWGQHLPNVRICQH